jgi:hypothetical protein
LSALVLGRFDTQGETEVRRHGTDLLLAAKWIALMLLLISGAPIFAGAGRDDSINKTLRGLNLFLAGLYQPPITWGCNAGKTVGCGVAACGTGKGVE